MTVRPAGSRGWLPWVSGLVAGLIAYTFGYQSRAWVNDVDAALQSAWAMLHRGDLRVPNAMLGPGEVWRTAHGVYSNRPLGMILAATPGQLFAPSPSELGSAVLAAIWCALTAFLAVRLFGRIGLIAVLGAPLLYVAGRTLWPETVGLSGMLLALTLARPARDSKRAAACLAVVITAVTLCRLPLGLLLVPVVAAWADDDDARRWWRSPTLRLNAAAFATGLALLIAFARWQLSSWIPNPGYPVSDELHVSEVAVGLLSPARGLLFWSPYVLAARLSRRGAVIVAWAGAYTVGSWLLYNAWGGDGYAGYRYALPLAFLVVPFVCTDTSWRRALISWSVGLGVTTTVLAARPIPRGRVWTHTGMPALVFGYAVLLSLVVFAGWEYLLRRRRVAAAPPQNTRGGRPRPTRKPAPRSLERPYQQVRHPVEPAADASQSVSGAAVSAAGPA